MNSDNIRRHSTALSILVAVFLVCLAFSPWPGRYLPGGISSGPRVQLPGGGCTIAWSSHYYTDRWTGVRIVKYTDALNPRNSHGWRVVLP